MAGKHAPAGAALTLTTDPGGIGQPLPTDPAHDLFLNFGGWQDVAGSSPSGVLNTAGTSDYAAAVFSHLEHTMSSMIPVQTVAQEPTFGVPRVNQPTVYAELEWAGRFLRLDQARVHERDGETPDFPPPATDQRSAPLYDQLDRYIVLSYYYFYPVMEPPPVPGSNGPNGLSREGQWEAISIFLRGTIGEGPRDPEGRPSFVDSEESPLEPRFVAYSTGYSRGDDSDVPLTAQIRPWGDVAKLVDPVSGMPTHPLVYVSAGTHRNLFEIIANVTPGSSTPNVVLSALGGAIMGTAGTVAGVCLGLLPPPLTPGAIACLVASGVAFLVGLLLFILSFVFSTEQPQQESPMGPGFDVARDGGPAAEPGTVPSNTVSGALPPSSMVSTNLRIINRFHFANSPPPVTTYPVPRPLEFELPTWWDFMGRWGVKTLFVPSSGWDSGTRRVDEFGRSRAYWNTYRIIAFLTDPANAGVTL